MAQISLPPWQEFYDSTRNDIITTTTNSVLNGKLYAMLIVACQQDLPYIHIFSYL